MISLATAPNTGVATDPVDQIILASYSGTNTCFYYRHVATAAVGRQVRHVLEHDGQRGRLPGQQRSGGRLEGALTL